MKWTEAKVRFGTVLLLWAMVMLNGCDSPHEQVLVTDFDIFREGDLVLRCGCGMESKAVTQASKSAYSHIGLLHKDEQSGHWMVVHAVPGEAKQEEPEWLKCEEIGEFFAFDRAIRGAWMRVDCPDSIAAKAADYALEKVRQKVEFDNDYAISDTSQLYCTELVWRAYLQQGIDLSNKQRHDVPTFFSTDGECIYPSDIQNSNIILFVKPFKSKQL